MEKRKIISTIHHKAQTGSFTAGHSTLIFPSIGENTKKLHIYISSDSTMWMSVGEHCHTRNYLDSYQMTLMEIPISLLYEKLTHSDEFVRIPMHFWMTTKNGLKPNLT